MRIAILGNSGRVQTWIGEDVYILGPGDAARHPPGVQHAVEALVESTILEVKSPAVDITRLMGTAREPRGYDEVAVRLALRWHHLTIVGAVRLGRVAAGAQSRICGDLEVQ